MWCAIARRIWWRLTRHSHFMPSTISSLHFPSTPRLPQIYLIKLNCAFVLEFVFGCGSANHHTSQLNSNRRSCVHIEMIKHGPRRNVFLLSITEQRQQSPTNKQEKRTTEKGEIAQCCHRTSLSWKESENQIKNVCFCFCCWFVCIVTDRRPIGSMCVAQNEWNKQKCESKEMQSWPWTHSRMKLISIFDENEQLWERKKSRSDGCSRTAM